MSGAYIQVWATSGNCWGNRQKNKVRGYLANRDKSRDQLKPVADVIALAHATAMTLAYSYTFYSDKKPLSVLS